MVVSLQPDAKSNTHDRFPGETPGGVQQAVLVLAPPVAIDILLADLTLGPAAVSVTGFLGVHGNVLHSSYFLSVFEFFQVLTC